MMALAHDAGDSGVGVAKLVPDHLVGPVPDAAKVVVRPTVCRLLEVSHSDPESVRQIDQDARGRLYLISRNSIDR